MSAQSPVATAVRRLVIVDPRLNDYHCLVEPARKHLVRLTLVTSGSNALRLAPSFADALWLVSPQLPDMNGLDLMEMLLALQSKLTLVVIDNDYHERHERRALEQGAIQYVCKPLKLSWLAAWQGLAVAEKQEPKQFLQRDDQERVSLYPEH